jgi:prepilin-type N-terminal cleavage/methylation domain-containing protein
MVTRGFSLLELLLALTITLGLSLAGFQLLLLNQRVFQDQNSRVELQQSSRAVVFQISDEIRRAGQGLPFFAASFDITESESVVEILNGSDATRLRMRASVSNIESSVSMPMEYRIGTATPIPVGNAAVFSNALGTATPMGRFVFIWGTGLNSCWSWVRAELKSITPAANSLTAIPVDTGEACRNGAGAVQFESGQKMTLEESVSIFFQNGSVWRATSTDMTQQMNPIWGPSSELARNVTGLTFTYYDQNETALDLLTLSARRKVASVDVGIRVNPVRQTVGNSFFGVTLRAFPRNPRIL